MTQREDRPDLYVLDALANDVENLDGVLRALNSESALGWRKVWGRQFTRDEIVGSLLRMMRDGHVRAYVLSEDGRGLEPLPLRAAPARSFDDAWFGMTEHGKIRHATWQPKIDD